MTNSFNLVFPFQKIDKEQRLVTGIATADNIDYEDDRIDFEGSLDAFSSWIGNIREMHSPIAVGKLIDYKPVPVLYNGESYNGIEVTVYISRGAQSTWEKILDGTLRGFSIGGISKEIEMDYDESVQRRVRVIKEYVLGELSVVDNPCNPAGLFTMVKMQQDGTLKYTHDIDSKKAVAGEIAEGDYVSFVYEGEAGVGRVEYVMTEGTFGAEDSEYAIDASEEEPVALIRLYESTEGGFEETELLMGFRIEALTVINDQSASFAKAIDLRPTESMASNARRGLEWRREYGRGGTAVGVARARDISARKNLSPSTVRRMKSFFARHEVDKKAQGFRSGEEGFPSAGRIAWELWGGESGKTWANSKDAQLDREEGVSKSVGGEEPIFYCSEDKYAVLGDENNTCPICATNMQQIGRSESFDAKVINKMILNFEKKGGENSMNLHESINNDNVDSMDELTDKQREGVIAKLGDILFGNKAEETSSVIPNITVNIDGSILGKSVETTDDAEEAVADETEVEEAVQPEDAEETDDSVEKSLEVEDSASNENGGDEMDLTEILEKFTSVLDEKLEKVKADITADVDEKISKSVSEVREATSETIEDLTDEVNKIADSGAIKKSVEVDSDDEVADEVIEKSVDNFWGGKFVPTPVVKALGYDS